MINCDGCTRKLDDQDDIHECSECLDELLHYCKKCIKKFKDEWEEYCIKHFEEQKSKRSSETIIANYAKLFWKEVGLEIAKRDEGLVFDAQLSKLALKIHCIPTFKDATIESITYKIIGLINDEMMLNVSIYNHEKSVSIARNKIVETLKHKLAGYKSSKTAFVNKLQNEISSYDEAINVTTSYIEKWSK